MAAPRLASRELITLPLPPGVPPWFVAYHTQLLHVLQRQNQYVDQMHGLRGEPSISNRLHMLGSRIVEVDDPVNPFDALNLRHGGRIIDDALLLFLTQPHTWTDVQTFPGGVIIAMLLDYAAENKDAGALSAGQIVAVHSSGTGVVKADATTTATSAVGLARTATAPTVSGDIKVAGVFTLADWTAVVGAVSLTAPAFYYLATTPGQLTTAPPSAVGNIVQVVGVAVAPDTLDLRIDDYILL